VEELAIRGWLMTRLAEIGRFSAAAWIVAHGCLDTTGFVLIYFGVYPGL